MPALAVHALTTLPALCALYWAKPRLDCLFYSAFEYAQAVLIRSALAAPLRALGLQHWMYGHFFTPWRVSLLGLYYLSPVYLVSQFFLTSHLLWFVSGAFSAAAAAVMIICSFRRVTGQDRKKHLPYNSFAPLHERQRRELNRQRNRVTVSRLLQRMSFVNDTASADLSSGGRDRIRQKYQRY